MQLTQERPLVKKTSAATFRNIPIKHTDALNTYLNSIAIQIKKLNDTSNNDQKQSILLAIKKLDEAYIKSLKQQITGQVLLSRHGECNTYEQKKFGINPNTGLSEDAKNNMRLTSTYTEGLLYNPEEPLKVLVSPLLRALETANLILPAEKLKNVTIDSALSENSNAPSGFDVRSTSDLDAVIQNTPWYSREFYLFNLSKWFYADAFSDINQKRQDALRALNIPLNEDVPALDFQRDKIDSILETINTATPHSDVWMIGHGKNFRTFYKHVFEMPSHFDFAETRCMYKLKKNALFNPPYAFVINQKTGQIEGKFTGKLHLAAPNPKNMFINKEAPNTRYQYFKSAHQIALISTFTFAGFVVGLVLSLVNLGFSAPVAIPFFTTVGFALGLGFWVLLDCLVGSKNTPKLPPHPINQPHDLDTDSKNKKPYEDNFQYTKCFQPSENLIVQLEDSDSDTNESGMSPL